MDTNDLVDDFELLDEGGRAVLLSSMLEKGPVVLFFYPGAMTKGCTVESCHFRDLAAEFAELGATPVGISMDAVDKQRQFSSLHGFTFPLLSDPSGEVALQFGVKRKLDLLRVRRATFVIGRDRRVVGVVRSELRMSEHADRSLALLRAHAATA